VEAGGTPDRPDSPGPRYIHSSFHFPGLIDTDCSLGDLGGFYDMDGHISACLLTHTLSYVNTSAAPDSPSAPATPRKH
jgi:hypothetical protein